MAQVRLEQTYQGLSNQPPYRKQPGQVKDILNFNLDLAVGARTRNPTEIVARIYNHLPSLPYVDNTANRFYYSYKGDLIEISPTSIRVWDTNGSEKQVTTTGGTYSYLSQGTFANNIRCTAIRDSVVILNRNVTASTTNSANYTVTGEVNQFSDLPATAASQSYYKVKLNDGYNPQGYYYKDPALGNQWRLVAAPNQPNAKVVNTTMPHVLTKSSSGLYTFGPINWTDRLTGDDSTNPRASIFGDQIAEVCFHSGRLFLFGPNTICATSSIDLYSLYTYDINNASDVSNPIDLDVSNADVGDILYSTSVGAAIFLACDNGQLLFSAGTEQLTNVNGFDLKISNFPTNRTVRINSNNGTVLMLDASNNLHEFVYNASSAGIQYNGNLNSHALRIFEDRKPIGLYRFGNITFIPCARSDDPTKFYDIAYHERTVDNGSLIQTGWGRYSFNPKDKYNNGTVAMYEWNDNIYIVNVFREDDSSSPRYLYNNDIFVLRYQHKDYETPYGTMPAMDYVRYSTGVYNEATDETAFTYNFPTGDERLLLRGETANDTNKAIVFLTPKRFVASDTVNGTVYVSGNYNNIAAAIGRPFFTKMEMDKLYAGVSTAKPTISSLTVFYNDTLEFDLTARRSGSATGKTYHYQTPKAGVSIASDNDVADGERTFNILLDGRTGVIEISNEGTGYINISALAYEVRFSDTKGAK